MRSEDRKREIIDKSIELISRRGLHGFTIKNLSKKVGISEPALYRHFRNKFDILKSILLFFKEDSQNLVDEVKSSEVNWCTKIKLFFMGHLERLSLNHAYSTAIFAEDLFKSEKKLSRYVSEIIEINSETMLGFIKQGQTAGEVRTDLPPEHLALLVMGPMRLIVKRWYHSDYSFDLQKKGKKLHKTIIKILENGE
ncbi:TetR/AcrR family transcriptional regulator [Candidatus Dependentiae bacterium]|nr:TetR/AcrR family transcriptional regulator [Candidatus Dependentiae bacterium]